MDTLTLLVFASAVFVAAGAIKGLAGIGLPTASLLLLTILIDPRTAIALVVFPMFTTNLWQMYRGGHVLRTARRYWVFAAVLLCGVGLTAVSTRDVADRTLLGVLGLVVVVFSALSWRQMIPTIPDRWDRVAQAGFGAAAGIIGGLTAHWGAPMAIYLTARGADREEFIRAVGFLIVVGTIPLGVSYASLGFMTGPLAGASVAMVLPALVGFSMGEFLRRRLSAEGYRKAFLIVFVLLGLNLLRRAVF